MKSKFVAKKNHLDCCSPLCGLLLIIVLFVALKKPICKLFLLECTINDMNPGITMDKIKKNNAFERLKSAMWLVILRDFCWLRWFSTNCFISSVCFPVAVATQATHLAIMYYRWNMSPNTYRIQVKLLLNQHPAPSCHSSPAQSQMKRVKM